MSSLGKTVWDFQNRYHQHLITKYGQNSGSCPLTISKDKKSVHFTFDHPYPEIQLPILFDKDYESALKMAIGWAVNLKIMNITTPIVCILFDQMVEQNWISKELNEIQMFKAFLTFISNLKVPYQANNPVDTSVYPKNLKEFWSSQTPLYFVSKFLIDLFFQVPKCNIYSLVFHAKRSLSFLEKNHIRVTDLFTRSLDVIDFDSVFFIEESAMDCYDKMSEILLEALGDRIISIQITSLFNSREGSEFRVVGLYLNPVHCFGLTVLGPVHDHATPQQLIDRFRFLWGDKVELRRFSDASIKYSVVYEEAANDRTIMIKLLVIHLMRVHFPNLRVISPHESFDKVIKFGSFSTFLGVYEDFTRLLRGLKGLPLSIVETIPLSSSISGTSLLVPNPINPSGKIPDSALPAFVPVSDIMLVLEKSSRWPDDLQAISLLRQALTLSISKLFINIFHTNNSSIHENFMDVLYKGFVFRISIFCERELPVMQRNKIDYEQYWRDWVQRPLHHRLIRDVAVKNVLFGAVCRLAKKWVDSHLLANHLPEDLIELIVVSSMDRVSIIGCFMKFLFNLFNELVVTVDLDGKLPSPDDIMTEYYRQKGHKKDIFIYTSPQLAQKSHIIPCGLNEAALKYVKRISKASHSFLLSSMHEGQIVDIEEIFTPITDSFDEILAWNPSFLPLEKSTGKIFNVIREESTGSSPFMRNLPGFNPRLLLVEKIQAEMGRELSVFYGNESRFIGVTYQKNGRKNISVNNWDEAYPGAFVSINCAIPLNK